MASVCVLPTALCPSRLAPGHEVLPIQNGPGGFSIRNTPQSANIGSMSLREALESAIITYETQQPAAGVVTLTPYNSGTTYFTILTIRPAQDSQIGILERLVIDTTPDVLYIASIGSAFNLAAFGIGLSVTPALGMILTREMIRTNLVPQHGLVIAGLDFVPQLQFTNSIFVNVDIRVTYTLGIVDRQVAAEIIYQYQSRQIGV